MGRPDNGQLTQAEWDARRAESKATAQAAAEAQAEQDRQRKLATAQSVTGNYPAAPDETPAPAEGEEANGLAPYTELSDEELLSEADDRQLELTEVSSREDLIAALEADDSAHDGNDEQ